MRRSALASSILALAVAASPGPAALADETPSAAVPERPAPHSDYYRFEEVAPGVWAVLQPPATRFFDSNSVIVVTDRDAFVVDAQTQLHRVGEVADAVQAVTDKPLRWVVNTHWHGDHTQGNDVYRRRVPGVQVVGHRSLLEDVPGRARPQVAEEIERYRTGLAAAEQALETGIDPDDGSPLGDEMKASLPGRIERTRRFLELLEELGDTTPDVAYDEEMVFARASGEIRLLHLTAHTRGDTVVYLPRQRVLITGDVVDALPWAGDGYPSSWIAALDRLEALEVDVIVPGHGPVMRGKDQIRLVRELIATALAEAKTAVGAGTTLEVAKETIRLEGLRDRFVGPDDDGVAARNWDRFRPDLVERAYKEAAGTL